MLSARSMAEARLFIETEPCPGCGQPGFGHPTTIVEHGDDLAAEARGYCPRCGAHRTFELLLGDERVPPGAFGNQAPSTIIDAGQWFAIARDRASRVPAVIAHLDPSTRARAREQIAAAIAALQEVAKFLGAADEVLRTAIFSTSGREIYLGEPAAFSRARIELLLETWNELATSFVEN